MASESKQSVVGFRPCKWCGELFAKDMVHPKNQICPTCRAIGKKRKNKPTQAEITNALFREQKRSEKIEEEKRRERMRKRDAAFERFERENGFKARIEVKRNEIVETRGRVCGGFSAAKYKNQ